MHAILNETVVMNFFLEEMEEDKISFLRGRKGHQEKIKALIPQMIASPGMNEKIQTASLLWKALFEAAMTHIDSNKKGYSQFFQFFDAYVEFEELIFASDSFYRDHTLHCLWVFFLGEYIRRHDEFAPLFKDMAQSYDTGAVLDQLFVRLGITHCFDDFYRLYHNLTVYKEKEDAIRCISALTHDLGYPIKKFAKINKSIKRVLPFFSIGDYKEFSFEYTSIQQHYITNFINFISSDIFCNPQGTAELNFFSDLLTFDGQKVTGLNLEAVDALTKEQIELLKNNLKMPLQFIQSEAKTLAFTSDFQNYEHGIMSAFLLAKNLEAFQNIQYVAGENFSKHTPNYADFMAKQNILQSIALHTNETQRIASIDGFTYLTLVDELEEFSRISRASQSREFVTEFCTSQIYMEDGWLCVDFTFDNETLENLDPERAFKGRCKRFLTLFDIKNMAPSLKIRLRCISELKGKEAIYQLTISHKYADIQINGISESIPRYLKSNEFYPTEEYAKL
ncbi:MAG: hypothetical protein E7256_11340 [Lachnospiraceae bacterium]|nr:hypothetical protein [Lachnospiraceae bacterium]